MDAEVTRALRRVEARLESIELRLDKLPPGGAVALRPRDAARLLGCGVTVLNAMIRAGKLRTVRIGERPRVPMAELMRLTMIREPARRPPAVPPHRRKSTGRDSKAEGQRIRDLERVRPDLPEGDR